MATRSATEVQTCKPAKVLKLSDEDRARVTRILEESQGRLFELMLIALRGSGESKVVPAGDSYVRAKVDLGGAYICCLCPHTCCLVMPDGSNAKASECECAHAVLLQ